jgi:hypothetical protein
MVTYVYAIAERVPAGAAGMPGVGGLPVRFLRAAGLAVAAGDAPTREPLRAADLWAHELVVEALGAAGPVLPARFGSRLADDAAVAAFVAARAGALRSALSRVRGHAELAVRASRGGRRNGRRNGRRGGRGAGRGSAVEPGQAGAGPQPGPGTAYLATLSARAGWTASLRELVHRPLMALAADGRWDAARSGAWEATGAYLVDAGEVPRFAAAVAGLAGRLEGTVLTCTGPWPPYSFAAVDTP